MCDWELVGCDGGGRVKVLALSFNNMSGALPAAVGRLERLEDLDLEYNRLAGSIPAAVFNLTALVELGTTFRLNFHRFDRFELDLRGHTQP